MVKQLNKTPYLQVVDFPREMKGKGAPRSTVFGAIGRTKIEPYTKTLGGLVVTTTPGTGHFDKAAVEKASSVPKNTEFHIIGAASKTKVPGDHFGQVPYPGAFRSALGARL
jgi:hypothetical protein